MKYWLTGFAVILMLLVQEAVAPALAIAGIRPNLIQVLIVAIGASGGPWLGLLAGGLAGALQDILLGRFLGLFTLVWGALGLLTGLAERRLFKEHIATQVSLTFTGTAVAELLTYLLLSSFGSGVRVLSALRTIVACAVYNAALSPLFFPLVLRVRAILRAREQQA